VLRKLNNHSFSLNNMLHGGVHDVVLHQTDAMASSPYIWRGEVVGGQVILRGDVPDDTIRMALIAHAKSVFETRGLPVIDQMAVRANPPAGDWAGTAKRGLSAIAKIYRTQ
jgi:hypothetical protein